MATVVEPNSRPGKAFNEKGGDALLLALAMGLSIPKAARRAGIDPTIAYRRLRNPAFRQKVEELRQALIGQAVSQLRRAACEAIDTLRGLLSSDNEQTRGAAARTLLEHFGKAIEAAKPAQGKTGDNAVSYNWDRFLQTITGNGPPQESVEEEVERLLLEPPPPEGKTDD